MFFRIAMYATGAAGVLCTLLYALWAFRCRECRGDGFVTETRIGEDSEAEQQMPRVEEIACPLCNGTGWMHYRACPRCVGRGRLNRNNKLVPCPTCHGTGRLPLRFSDVLGRVSQALWRIAYILVSGVVLGWLLWGVWYFIENFAIQAGMM